MELSELPVPFKCTNNLCSLSPDGKLLAILQQLKLLILVCENNFLVNTFDCDVEIAHIEWAPDSSFVMCASYSPRAFVYVFSIERPSFRCKITEGTPGLVIARWSPDSRHILTVGILNVQLSIWSLANESVQYVHHLKKGSPGFAFSRDGDYLALLEQRSSKEYVLVLFSHSWVPAMRVECRGIWDVAGIAWCPDSSGICVWSCPPREGLQVLWLSGEASRVLLNTPPEAPQTLGVRCTAWSPTGLFLAYGANDDQVHLINTVTWQPIARFLHSSNITSPGCNVYEESSAASDGSVPKYAVVGSGGVTPCLETAPRGTAPSGGIRRIAFCPNGAWIASLDDAMPRALWIWGISSLCLHSVLILKQAISDFQWSPAGDGCLALCSSSRRVTLWTPGGGPEVFCSPLPTVSHVAWHPRGTGLLLRGAGEGCLHALPQSDRAEFQK